MPELTQLQQAFKELSKTLWEACILERRDRESIGAALHKLHVAVYEVSNA